MPRSSSSSKLYVSKQDSSKVIPPPPKTNNPVQPSFKDTVVQGFAWGMGSSLARRMFKPKVNPEIIPPNPVALDSNEIFKKYQECLERKDTTVSCEMLLDMSSK